jgi:hypothetical protein
MLTDLLRNPEIAVLESAPATIDLPDHISALDDEVRRTSSLRLG